VPARPRQLVAAGIGALEQARDGLLQRLRRRAGGEQITGTSAASTIRPRSSAIPASASAVRTNGSGSASTATFSIRGRGAWRPPARWPRTPFVDPRAEARQEGDDQHESGRHAAGRA
jgi:hypothetical protein